MIIWEYIPGFCNVTTTQQVKDLYELLMSGIPLPRTRAITKARAELHKLYYGKFSYRSPGCYEKYYSEELERILGKL